MKKLYLALIIGILVIGLATAGLVYTSNLTISKSAKDYYGESKITYDDMICKERMCKWTLYIGSKTLTNEMYLPKDYTKYTSQELIDLRNDFIENYLEAYYKQSIKSPKITTSPVKALDGGDVVLK